LLTDQLSILFQLRRGRGEEKRWAETQVMPIPAEARENVQMDMHHFLTSSTPVSQEQVDALAFQATASQSCIHTPGHLHQTPRGEIFQLGELGNMLAWHNQDVAGIDWMNVHEGDAQVVLVNKISRGETGEDVTEDAGCHKLII